ncbi:MAG: SDR family NAD(P)-dependent oxidoreductase [Clostridia bacterium]|nr:SDR family NAD(P)-dependent oxidoreductase [Clostridia bacterium]
MRNNRKIVVISGSSGGIGKELCELYRNDGNIVIGLARGGDVRVDMTDYERTAEIADEIAARYGRIDTVIANAGAGLSGATELLPLEDIEYQLALNYLGAINLVRACLKHMHKGSNAVFVSSACALFALPYRAVYCSGKAALNMTAFGMYMELKKHGIRVTSICPGDIRTGFTKNRVKRSDGGERYGDDPVRAARKIDSRENKRMKLKPAARKIYKCALSSRKPLYIIGAKYKFLNFLRHILPQKLFLDVTAKFFG